VIPKQTMTMRNIELCLSVHKFNIEQGEKEHQARAVLATLDT